jgi:type I restriction enzyme R subunit
LLHNLSGGRYEDLSSEEQLAVKEKAGEYESKISARRYAVIVDEAHSSQTGETAGELKVILGAGMSDLEDELGGGEVGVKDVLNKVMESRGKQKNLSFFAFTATPKGKTLNLFGRMGPSGKPESFHTYSMRQAIEEGFILDVLNSYTTYKTYYGLPYLKPGVPLWARRYEASVPYRDGGFFPALLVLL